MADEDQTQTPPQGEPEASAKTADFTIQNMQFTASTPYIAGHVLNEAEAASLNQTRIENLRNNFAGTIKAKLAEMAKETPPRTEFTEEETEKLKETFAEYEASYEFQGKRSSRAPVDPVKREANKMAREAITAALKTKNLTPSQLVEGQMDKLVATYLERNPSVLDEAKRRVETVKSLAGDALDGVDLTGMEKPPATPAPVPPEEPSAPAT